MTECFNLLDRLAALFLSSFRCLNINLSLSLHLNFTLSLRLYFSLSLSLSFNFSLSFSLEKLHSTAELACTNRRFLDRLERFFILRVRFVQL